MINISLGGGPKNRLSRMRFTLEAISFFAFEMPFFVALGRLRRLRLRAREPENMFPDGRALFFFLFNFRFIAISTAGGGPAGAKGSRKEK